jgi:hypothetical protein
MIIFNSSPLIHLTKIGKIEYILNIFDFIVIPSEVYSEVIEEGIKEGFSDATLLYNYVENKKIKKIEINKPDLILKDYLHPGEYETIILAQQLEGLLVIDDRKARAVAEQKNLEVLTTADVLLLLLKENVINSTLFQLNLSKYSANGWLAPNIYEKYLAEGKKYE